MISVMQSEHVALSGLTAVLTAPAVLSIILKSVELQEAHVAERRHYPPSKGRRVCF